MEYTLIKSIDNGDTINTIVEYNIEGILVQVDIPHFMPGSQDDINRGIINRFITEKLKLFPEAQADAEGQTEDYINE